MGSSEQGGSSVPAVVASPTTATQRTSEGDIEHQTPMPVPEVGKKPGGTCRARGAWAVEEMLLRHIILRFEAVSIYIFDVSL